MVHVGDEIAKGTFIATVGSTGITTGPHLHYEVLVNGRQVDPLRYRLPQPIAAQGAAAAEPAPPEGAAIAPVGGGAPSAVIASPEAANPAPGAAPAPR
jgi:murein DD-endopeptidase